jgi:tRNA threonylcarbamoyl adenosine modification protein YeaZ
MVFILSLDTATAATSVAVVSVDGGQPVTRARRQHVDPRAHGEQAARQVEDALTEAGIRPADLVAIVAGTGPGPFTGLRIGLATAVAMGQALDIPEYGVCSLDGIGLGATRLALVATDARRREIYWALYQDGRAVTAPAVGRPADVLPLLAQRGVRQAYGEGALRYSDVLRLPVAEAPRYPDPAALVAVAYDRIAAGKPGEPLTPQYLRRPDATPR